tara:strand:+ start:6422 stop:7711 length:1290 start_codon:yes stop_codon:yes gene_type:complete
MGRNGVLRNVGSLFSEKVITLFLALLVNVLLARYLGAENFGKVALFQSILMVCVLASDGGTRRVILTQKKDSLLVNRAVLILRLIFSICISAALIIFYEGVPSIQLVVILLVSPLEMYLHHYERMMKNVYLARKRLLIFIIFSLLRCGLVVLYPSLEIIMLTFVAQQAVLWAVVGVKYRSEYKIPVKYRLRWKRVVSSVRVIALRGGFFWLSMLSLQIAFRLDQLLLANIVSVEASGLYMAAKRLMEQLVVLTTVLSTVMIPLLTRFSISEREKMIAGIYAAAWLLGGFCSLIGYFMAPTVVQILYGDEYLVSGGMLGVMMLSAPFVLIANLSGIFYAVNKSEKQAFYRNFITLIFSSIFIWFGVGVAGLQFAPWGFVGTYVFSSILSEFCNSVSRRNLYIKARSLKIVVNYKCWYAYVEELRTIMLKV